MWGLSSLLEGWLCHFLSHWSNVTTITQLLEITPSYFGLTVFWSSCQTASAVLLSLLSSGVQITILVQFLTVPAHLCVWWGWVALSGLNVPVLYNGYLHHWLSLSWLFCNISPFHVIHTLHPRFISFPFLAIPSERNQPTKAFQAPNCKHHHCVFLVYFSSVTFQSSGSKTMCEKVRGRLRVWILTNTPGKQKRARAWVLWNCICAYWLCDCERNIMVSLSQFLKPNLEPLTISSRCYCEDSIAGYSV